MLALCYLASQRVITQPVGRSLSVKCDVVAECFFSIWHI